MSDPATQPLVVLQTQPASRDMTRYGAQITDHAPADTVHLAFTWRRALFGRHDVVHAHWPEYLLRHRWWPVRQARRFGFRLFLRRLRREPTAVVRTVHNLSPHDAGDPGEAALLDRFTARTDLFVALNPYTELPAGVPSVTIPHGHYVEQFGRRPSHEPVPGRLLHIGQLKPYKGVEELLTAFRALPATDLSLRIVGRPFGDALRAAIEAAATEDDRVTCDLRVVPDDVLVDEINAAEVVVLPYRRMHNSGILLVALSLARPVIAPANDVNRHLAAEVGDGWLIGYDGDLTAATLAEALERVRAAARSEQPRLAGRDWPSVAAAHAAAYRLAVAAHDARQRSDGKAATRASRSQHGGSAGPSRMASATDVAGQ